MALTLTEAAKLSNDTLLAGVIETMAEESPILQRLPFIEITGNGLTYNREDSAPAAGFYGVGDDWDEDTPTFTQQTASLKILGGDADIDNFLKETRSNVQDLEAAVLQLKARAVQALFDKTFVTGNATTNADSFDGVEQLCANAQAVSMGDNGGTLTLAKLDELIDKVRPGQAPDAAHEPPLAAQAERARARLGNLPGGGPRRVRGDGAVLRRHPHRHQRLHRRRADGGHEPRRLDGLRDAVRGGRPGRPFRAERPLRRPRGRAGDRRTPLACG